MPDAASHSLNSRERCPGPLSVITRSTSTPSPPVEVPGAPHERGAGLLALVAEQLGVGHAAAVVDRHVQAREPAARTPAVVRRAGSARPPAPAVGDPRDLLDVDVHELAGPPPLAAARGRGAAPPGLAGHAVGVGQARQAVARDDPGAGTGGHPGLGGEGERGEQAGAAGLHDPRLDVGGREPREARGAAAAVRQRLARLGPRDQLAGRLPARARLPGDGGNALAGADALDEPLPPAGREP